MKIICSRKHLKEAGMLCEKIAGRNPTLPILNAILISTQNKTLCFTSTNLEMALEVFIPCKTEKEGKIAVPAKLFSSFISSLSEENVKLEEKNDNLLLNTASSSTTIKGYPINDFPILPKIKEKKPLVVSISEFVSGLKSVYYSASLSEMKPELNSIYLHSSKNIPLTFVATDSFRLAEKSIPYNFSDSPNFLISYRSIVEVLRIFENQSGDLKIFTDDNNFILSSDNVKFTSRLTEGVFPDYKQIIPGKFTTGVVVDKKRLLDELRTTSVFCGKLNEIKLRIYKGENFIELQSNNPDLGEHTVAIPSKIEGEDLSMVFNYRYLLDCFGFINSDKAVLKFGGEGRPLLISGFNDVSFRYLVMPMKDM